MSPKARDEAGRTTYLCNLPIGHWLRGLWIGLNEPVALAQTFLLVVTQPYLRRTTLRGRAQALVAWLRAFGVAGLVTRQGCQHIHADFADDTATVAWVVHRLTGLTFSFRSHTSFNPQLLRHKLQDSLFVLAISEYDSRCLIEIGGPHVKNKVIVNHLGVDCERWSPPESSPVPSSNQIVCVGTLQEKKGHRYLIEACKILQREAVPFRCVLIGDGPLRGELQRTVDAADLGDRVLLLGHLPNSEVKRLTGEAEVVCAPSVTARDGDLDGIPYVLMEAMALGKACVSTFVSGIPELIEDELHGLLVPERDPAALAAALKRLLLDESLRDRLGGAARKIVEEEFGAERNARSAVALFPQRGDSVAQEGVREK